MASAKESLEESYNVPDVGAGVAPVGGVPVGVGVLGGIILILFIWASSCVVTIGSSPNTLSRPTKASVVCLWLSAARLAKSSGNKSTSSPVSNSLVVRISPLSLRPTLPWSISWNTSVTLANPDTRIASPMPLKKSTIFWNIVLVLGATVGMSCLALYNSAIASSTIYSSVCASFRFLLLATGSFIFLLLW